MQISKEQLKFIGGAVIVLAAAAVMFNELFSYVFSLGRMFTLIGIALIIALAMTLVMVRLRGRKQTATSFKSESDLDSNSNVVDVDVEGNNQDGKNAS